MEKLREQFDFQEDLIKSAGGVFEVKADGELIFSKKETGRFPEDDEIEELLRQRI